jgi:hypothetical protein
MYSRYTGIPPSSVAYAERIGREARERVIREVLGGVPLSKAWVDEVTRCRAAWKHLDPDTYELALEEARNLSEIQHIIEQRLAQRTPWWQFWRRDTAQRR